MKTLKGSIRREEILKAATVVFASRGYEGASLREISEITGISKGNLSYYFAVKDDLLFEIVNDLHDRFLHLTESWATFDGSPEVCLRHALWSHALLVCNASDSVRILFENYRHLSKQRRAAIARKAERYEEALRALVLKSAPATAANPELATFSVLGMLNWPYHWYHGQGGSAKDVADQVSAMAMKALGL